MISLFLYFLIYLLLGINSIMALAEAQRTPYPPEWNTAPDRYLKLWRGNDRGGRGEVVRTSFMYSPTDINNNCYTLSRSAVDEHGRTVPPVGKSEANSVESRGVVAFLYNKDACRTGTRRVRVGENQYIPKLSDQNFANRTNSVLIEWNEADKLPCCLGVKDYLDKRMCDYNWIGTNTQVPRSPCYQPIKIAISNNPRLLEYGEFRDWCRGTQDCDSAVVDYCTEINPDDPLCGCVNSDFQGGLAVCADEKCTNRAAYRTRAMSRAEAACPDVMDCRQYFTQIGEGNIAEGTSQALVCQMFKEQGKLGDLPDTPPGAPTAPPGAPPSVPTRPPYVPPTAPPVSAKPTGTTNIWIYLIIIIAVVLAAAFLLRGENESPESSGTIGTIGTIETIGTVQPTQASVEL